ncbi:rhomboid family intramembrane serine protease [Hymenobacter jejuensis]|uniref:Rhomboid family intramembrane serine protease n=1 Tax=Hymenobacter jejuensis TaxID=2502781 RepID=A0A5B8A562_9BACT|nr:rhomboid family intramembrane serine protease [Hymenobacter sp. BT491]QDA62498.1 rhomboid family intramembrane serine protease [Hymenobacter jejuensis]
MDASIILLVLTAGISMYAWSNPGFMQSWIFSPFIVARQNQWYRLLTSGFLHADWMHLIFNMLAFYSFGQVVQSVFVQQFGPGGGVLRFLLLYLGGIIISDIPTYFKHRNDPDYRSLGASGGVAAIIFAGVLFQPTAGIIMFPLPIPIPGFIWGLLYLAYSYYQGRRMGDHINHDAHFYGALYGLLLTLALIPQVGPYFVDKIQQYFL